MTKSRPSPVALLPPDFVPAAISAAILVMLAGLAIPYLRTRELQSADDRARADLVELRTAIRDFMRDTGLPPTRDTHGRDESLLRLIGPGIIPEGTYYAADEQQGSYIDHLYRNEPLGPRATGYAGWKGPYLQRIGVDPWGGAYSIVAYPLNLHDGRQCLVVCAGPNGRMDADYSSPRQPIAAGDDLIEVVPVSRPNER